jgi:hypothetical protein
MGIGWEPVNGLYQYVERDELISTLVREEEALHHLGGRCGRRAASAYIAGHTGTEFDARRLRAIE